MADLQEMLGQMQEAFDLTFEKEESIKNEGGQVTPFLKSNPEIHSPENSTNEENNKSEVIEQSKTQCK